ncbi:MAG TPA: type II secretion system protein, partial [Patescibacteria group bacterium]|nr:type II secretion system protein [Patescibacteria group bacterium]
MQYFWDQKKQKGFTPTPNFGVSLQSKRGFTLVELLVVIAVIAILFAVILLALNPAQRFKDSRNARRLTDVRSIVDAVATYTADKKGALPANIPDGQCIGSKPADSFSTNPTGSTAVWKFDTSYADSQPVANNLVSLATTFTTGSAGKFGEAIQMNGSTSSLSAADHAELDPASSALTLEGWVKLNQ